MFIDFYNLCLIKELFEVELGKERDQSYFP